MKILDRYILKQVFLATAFAVALFIILWISPEILFRIIKQVVYGEISNTMAIKLFFLQIPEILSKAIPVGLMIGSLFVFDRMSRDSELIIIRGIGVNFFRLAIPVIVLSSIGILACHLANEYLVPYSTSYIRTLQNNFNQDHFVYVDKTETDKPSQIFIIDKYNGKNFENMKILGFSLSVSNDNPLIKNIVTAKSAEWMNDHWKLIDGMEYQIATDGVYKNIISFKERMIPTSDGSMKAYNLLIGSIKKAKEMSTPELQKYIALVKSVNMKEELRYMESKYFQRFSQPFSCVLFALCGLILGYSKPREKRILGFTIGVGLIFLYYLTLPFLDVLAQLGIILPSIAAWIPNLVLFIAIISLIKIKRI